MYGSPASSQDPDDQALANNPQRAMQRSASHTPTSLLPSGGEPNVPGDVGPMEAPGEMSYEDVPMSPNTLQQQIHDLGGHPLETYDARTVLARAVLALCNDAAACAVTGQLLPEEQPSFQAPVVNEHHSYMPAPLPPPVVEYYDDGDPEPLEVPDVPRPVRPHAGEWWYFPAPVLVAGAVDWQGRPFLIWKRPTADQLAMTPVRRGVAYYRVPHDHEPPLGENLPPSAYQPETASTSGAPQAPGASIVGGPTGQSPPSFTTFEELAAGWGQGAHAEGFIHEDFMQQQEPAPRATAGRLADNEAPDTNEEERAELAGNGVTRTVHFDVKVEEAEVGIDFSRP